MAAATGYLSASADSPMTKMSSAEAERPVRERLRARVGRRARPGLGEMCACRQRSAEERRQALDRRAGVAERSDRDDGSANRPDDRVDRIPDRIHPRNLVGDELDDVEDERDADHDIVVEDAELLGKVDPAESLGEAEDRDRRVQVDAGGERETHGPTEERESLEHGFLDIYVIRSLGCPSC